MANLKSAIKRVNVNNKKRQNNQVFKSSMRTAIKQVEHFIAENDHENAKQSFHSATRVIDKAIQKGAVHRNNGNRQKARLAQKLNQLAS